MTLVGGNWITDGRPPLVLNGSDNGATSLGAAFVAAPAFLPELFCVDFALAGAPNTMGLPAAPCFTGRLPTMGKTINSDRKSVV